MTTLKGDSLVKALLEQRDTLLGFILALSRDRSAAEEIFQDVGLAVVEESRRGTQVERFLPWAHETARRRVAEYFRKRQRSFAHLESLDEAVGQAFEEQVEDRALARLRQSAVEDCLEQLPPAQRALVERRYRDQASIRQIADAMDWSDGAVKVGLWKARRRLAGCVEGKVGEGD